jgi:hypothetical protein
MIFLQRGIKYFKSSQMPVRNYQYTLRKTSADLLWNKFFTKYWTCCNASWSVCVILSAVSAALFNWSCTIICYICCTIYYVISYFCCTVCCIMLHLLHNILCHLLLLLHSMLYHLLHLLHSMLYHLLRLLHSMLCHLLLLLHSMLYHLLHLLHSMLYHLLHLLHSICYIIYYVIVWRSVYAVSLDIIPVALLVSLSVLPSS